VKKSTGGLGVYFFLLFLAPAVLQLLTGCSSRPVPIYSPPAAPSAPAIKPGAKVGKQNLNQMTGAKSIVHEVGPLETVWRLSKMYDVPIADIYRANGLQPGGTIKVGQKLVIPNAKTFHNVVALYPNKQWKYIVIHHTATDIGNAILIHKSHHDRGFWYGLGYHFLIDNGTLGKGDGQIEQSPRWIKQMQGAHCKAGGMNSRAIGIALVGNFNQDAPTHKQMQSLEYLLKLLCQYYHISTNNIVGHRDVDGAATDCPGKRFPWSQLRQCLSSS